MRRTIAKPAEMALQGDPENAAALRRWRTGYTTTLALREAVVLYGVVIRGNPGFLRFSAGIVLVLFFRQAAHPMR